MKEERCLISSHLQLLFQFGTRESFFIKKSSLRKERGGGAKVLEEEVEEKIEQFYQLSR